MAHDDSPTLVPAAAPPGAPPGAPAPAPASRTALARALDTIRSLRAQLDAQRADQPLAVVGVGLRLPGGIDDLDGYWTALAAGRDLVTPLSQERMGPFADQWAGLHRKGGFLDEVMDFDAGFFGIGGREARRLDPQHRLLLEVAWEALEDAALPPERLTETRTGFFVGITNQDYDDWRPADVDAVWGIGNAICYSAGRVAFTLGLTGPAMAVDTSCSSSLVAVHLARQALLRGECEVALAAGVNLIVSPASTRLISQSGLLAPDGLCKPFDARANGFTRSEGCGIVVLKRLADARRDNDRIHAVIAGSALNQDGRSASITAPNVRSQIDVIAAALADAGLTAADIGHLEAHGTGTALGDPIEMDAIATVLGRPRGGRRLTVGSVKSNLGHLESAAGMAGLLKAILCVQRRAVPPLVHFRTLNPRLDLADTGIAIPTEVEAWSPDDGRYAGVSSFGMSGTNAHVIVGPADVGTAVDIGTAAGNGAAAGAGAVVGAGAAVGSGGAVGTGGVEGVAAAGGRAVPVAGFEVAARTPDALRVLAARYRDRLATLPDDAYPAFAYTATVGRARHPVRARVLATSRSQALAALDALAAGTPVEPGGGELTELPRAVVDLPHYPWERRRYAIVPAGSAETPAATLRLTAV
ncbi:Beta-ketoacyl synthase, C-terminal domain [Parafrankia irregularis]|uniref:Beta-ketoacyl synthase, C-terminal domain n=1 Tax=Parafrankia irregularis TaxID=795642 RepID=A0A0S4QUT5_9ACTN|nr:MULTISPECIES: polyketide synthase [Parafrankia]MBE3205836.1 polyketide synthase [Parafrankia sp. CH37]CUU58218.1 Beta-ketoacyl synthase, C-terminal domain [Parafrankia irregularis]